MKVNISSHTFWWDFDEEKTPNWQINWQHLKWQHGRQKTVNISLITVMIKAIADCRNVHRKLFYLDQNLRNFCLPYYSNDPDESIQLVQLFCANRPRCNVRGEQYPVSISQSLRLKFVTATYVIFSLSMVQAIEIFMITKRKWEIETGHCIEKVETIGIGPKGFQCSFKLQFTVYS